MTHYEQRLENDLDRLRSRVDELAGRVAEAIKDAVHALLSGNDKLAYATILADGPINRSMRDIDRLCHAFIALHLPSAGHLRLISSIMRVNIELERIGDYAVTICRESVQRREPPTGAMAREIELMAENARSMLIQATTAFSEGDANAAKATMGMADQLERTFDIIFHHLVTEGSDEPTAIKELFGMLTVFNMLERTSDQAKNICEETVFAVTGATKAKKRYRVLFIDEDNSCQSLMAEALARKNFPKAGEYSSAGRSAAQDLHPALGGFLESRGVDTELLKPKNLDVVTEELADLHVIVSLQGSGRSYVVEVPFHTSMLDWDVGTAPENDDQAQIERVFEDMYRQIAVNVRDLMHMLRGEEES